MTHCRSLQKNAEAGQWVSFNIRRVVSQQAIRKGCQPTCHSEGLPVCTSLGFGNDLFGRLDDDIFGSSGKICGKF